MMSEKCIATNSKSKCVSNKPNSSKKKEHLEQIQAFHIEKSQSLILALLSIILVSSLFAVMAFRSTDKKPIELQQPSILELWTSIKNAGIEEGINRPYMEYFSDHLDVYAFGGIIIANYLNKLLLKASFSQSMYNTFVEISLPALQEVASKMPIDKAEKIKIAQAYGAKLGTINIELIEPRALFEQEEIYNARIQALKAFMSQEKVQQFIQEHENAVKFANSQKCIVK